MKNLEFPIIGTKVKGLTKKFNLESPQGREEYFQAKVGDEIKHIQNYLRENTFVAYFLGKKGSGKGTYSKILAEIFGKDKIAHISVGDLIREADDWQNFTKTTKYDKLKKYYRGFVSFEKAVDAHLGRSTTSLLPTEFILALLKAHIDELRGKAIFIDGLPRNMDQVSYSLYFRDVINYREDPDFFILIDIPETVIAERITGRVVCPKCQTARNMKFMVTSKIEYDRRNKEFFLLCDNPGCSGGRMVRKEGDEKGIKPIRERLANDESLIKTVMELHGIPKILLRNHIPLDLAEKYYDDYEISPEFVFNWDSRKKKVDVSGKAWVFNDDNKVPSYSLLAPAVVVGLIKRMMEILGL